MALINIVSIIQESIRQLKKISAPGGIELLSYKRDRGLALIHQDEEAVLISEYGYLVEDKVVAIDDLGRELKIRIKREFPRSRKVRLNKFQDPAELDRVWQKI